MAAPLTLRIIDPTKPEGEDLGSAMYSLDDQQQVKRLGNGVALIEGEDGSVTFDEHPQAADDDDDDNGEFYRNLADRIDDADLSAIANDLMTGILLDIDSRRDWLDTRALGIKLLGLKLEEPRGDLGTTSAPLEGMSQIRHPLLLEATVRFQATARGELLPAAGPVKVRNDMPVRPDRPQQQPMQPPQQAPMMGNNGGPPLDGDEAIDDLGAALEKDFNHFLTATATEYVPDTDRMLFYIGFGGDGFKKVYNDPLKRRPVSESVDAEDIIISNHATDIRNCSRVTHRIKMKRSTLRRMQIAGHYRKAELRSPNPNPEIDAVEQAKAEIGGYKPSPMQPKDADYEIYECYCELDLDQFAPKQFKGEAVPLPYVVTMERESRQVLAVRRNWSDDDEECLPKQAFVQFPFIRGLGFYGIGLVHLLGNVTMALTALWREMIDAGMFANFPGFLFAKTAGRQNTNQIRVPPGGGFPVEVPPGMKISDAFMPVPYKEAGAGTVNLATHIEEVGQRLGQTADINIGEGKQDVPVGTTMALIEQATKIMDSVHKRLHAAQAEEFQLLKERFREDPEAFWRHNKKPSRKWEIDEFKRALNERELVPVSDPNNPTSLHRIAKATVIDMLVTKYPLDIDRRAALKRLLHTAGIDADGLINAQPQAPPPDPRILAIQAKAQAEGQQAQIDAAKLQFEQQRTQSELANDSAERNAKQVEQQFEMQMEKLRLQNEMIIHAHDIQRDNAQAQQDITSQRAETAHGLMADQANAQAQLQQTAQKHQLDLAANMQKHQQELITQRQQHAQDIQLEREKHQADLENQRQIAQAKAQAIGPEAAQKSQRETEAHQQSMQTGEAKLKMQGERHKADIANDKKLTDAKAKALLKPKPKPSGDK